MIGSIMFSMVETRPDVAFTTLVASCFAKNPGHQQIEVVKTILQYLKGTKDQASPRMIKKSSSLKDIETLTRLAIRKANSEYWASFSY